MGKKEGQLRPSNAVKPPPPPGPPELGGRHSAGKRCEDTIDLFDETGKPVDLSGPPEIIINGITYIPKPSTKKGTRLMTKKENERYDALVENLLDLRRANAEQRTAIVAVEGRMTQIGCNLVAVLMKLGFPEVVTLGEEDLNGVAYRFVKNQYAPRVEDIDIPKLQRVLAELRAEPAEKAKVEPKKAETVQSQSMAPGKKSPAAGAGSAPTVGSKVAAAKAAEKAGAGETKPPC